MAGVSGPRADRTLAHSITSGHLYRGLTPSNIRTTDSNTHTTKGIALHIQTPLSKLSRVSQPCGKHPVASMGWS